MEKRRWLAYLLIFAAGISAGFCISYAKQKAEGKIRFANITKNAKPVLEAEADGDTGEEPEAAEGAGRLDAAGDCTDKSLAEPEFDSGGSLVSGKSALGYDVHFAESNAQTGTGACSDPRGHWDKDTVYLGGDRAVYNGKIYRAKWWTLGEKPGAADVWEDTMETPAPAQAQTDSGTISQKAGTESDAAGASVQKQANSQLKVVGYYPDWKGYQPEKLQFDILTHVVYAFAIPTAEGGVRPLDNPDVARRLIEESHKNQVKVLLAVGGWSYNGSELEPVFMQATDSSEKIKQFGDQIISMCDQYGFDGIDIDWEHPRIDGNSRYQYQELMLYLSGRLHDKGKLLTSAVISGVSPDNNVYYDAAAHSDQVLQAVDWIHVMAYDGGDGERHSSYEFAVNCGNYWIRTRNMPKEKVVLGVPFYGRPGWGAYGDILSADAGAGEVDHVTVNGMDTYYNGIPTMEKKTAFARDNMGGIMIWEITQDTAVRDKSLLSAIGRIMQ